MSTASDVERYVPDDAESRGADTVGPTLYVVDDGPMYSTGVRCRSCGCHVARVDGGRPTCPACGWEDDE